MNEEFHNLFPQGGPNTVAGQYFSGASYLCPLSDMGVSVSNVTFEPGCRNNWHIHHGGGQILSVHVRQKLLSGMGRTGQGTASRRCGQYPAGGQALARRSTGQLVCSCGDFCSWFPCRVVGTCG